MAVSQSDLESTYHFRFFRTFFFCVCARVCVCLVSAHIVVNLLPALSSSELYNCYFAASAHPSVQLNLSKVGSIPPCRAYVLRRTTELC